MSESEIQEEKELKEVFSEALKGPLDFEILGRALSPFLTADNELYDFDAHFNPPILLPEELFKALILDLSDYFDGFNFTDFANRIFLTMLGSSFSKNKKRLVIIYEHKNVNGEIFYAIENINAKTYIDH
jgi:hypothetical protein